MFKTDAEKASKMYSFALLGVMLIIIGIITFKWTADRINPRETRIGTEIIVLLRQLSLEYFMRSNEECQGI